MTAQVMLVDREVLRRSKAHTQQSEADGETLKCMRCMEEEEGRHVCGNFGNLAVGHVLLFKSNVCDEQTIFA